jgi:GT2 family glycosyltransferase/ADP-heptose:LPS heptosyltransferase
VLPDLIQSWELTEELTWEIIFVDDNCPSNSKETVINCWKNRQGELKHPIGKIVFNSQNKGYGLSCNTGAEYAKGKYLVFLNADTRVTKGWLKPFVELLVDPQIGIVGNLQLKEGGIWDGYIDGAGSEWVWNKGTFEHIGRHSYQRQELSQPMKPEDAPSDLLKESEREMVTGCCFGISSELFRYVGGYNPNYRIGYWEDAELSLTVRELGYKVLFTPRSVIYHKLSHTHSGGHPFATFNKQYFFNKWVNSGRIDALVKDKRQDYPAVREILIRRSAANGDVLVAAGVASALKKKYKNVCILFLTDCPDVLKGHPYIDRVVSHEEVSERMFQVFYDLDMCYEYRPYTNILRAYAEFVGVDYEDCEVIIQPESIEVPNDFIVVHVGRTNWVGRNWSINKFEEIVAELRTLGNMVVCVGANKDFSVPCDIDLKGKTSIGQLAEVISKAKLFIGIDSMPMHIAQAMNTPGVCFFGSVNPDKRIYRSNMHGITANTPCLGCHHRKPTPCVVTNMCEVGDEPCIEGVSVGNMLEIALQYL